MLKDDNLSLQNAFNKTRSLEVAQKNAKAYCIGPLQLIISPKTIAKMESKLANYSSDKEHSAAIIRKRMYCGIKHTNTSFVQQKM